MLERYARQMRYAPIGEAGQRKIGDSRVLVCGCGALGSVLANTMVRAGVGQVRIVDRDFLELNNLQRQVLYDEEDVRSGLPKAIAAAAKLRKINSEIEIEPIVADVDHKNIGELIEGVDLILDGTDNFETRYLLNDAAVKFQIPWVFGGCLGADGQSLTIIPGETPCLRCLFPEPPNAGAMPTCDAAGILSPAINIVASLQSMEALKILSGHKEQISRSLTVLELWDSRIRQLNCSSMRNPECPTCGRGEFEWLEGRRGSHTAVLCGRNAVQLTLPERQSLSLETLAEKLAGVGQVSFNRYLLRLTIEPYQVTVFPDGRAIINGTEDVAEARTVYAKYIGL